MIVTGGPDVCATSGLSHWNYPVEALHGVTVLAVSPDEVEHRVLRGLFDHTKWVLDHAVSLKGAWERLDSVASPVILVSERLADGDWRDLLARIPDAPDSPKVILTTHRLTPDLYEQALREKAFDVLSWPIQASQLYPAVSDAWRQWKCYTGRSLVAFA